MSLVKGHYRNVDGKLVWVAEHEREGAAGHKIHSIFDDWAAPVQDMLVATPPGGFHPDPISPEPAPKAVDLVPGMAHEPKPDLHDTAGLAAGTDLGSGIDAPESKDDLTKEHYQDVGVKIGGAAKDKAALKAKYYKQALAVSLDDLETLEAESPELAQQLLTKEQQLGTKAAFLEQMKSQGATPGCAYVAGRIYATIGEPVDTPSGRKAFALGIKRIEKAVSGWHTMNDAVDGIVALSDEVKGFWLPPEDAKKLQELREARGAAKKSAMAGKSGAINLMADPEYKAAADAYWAFNKEAMKKAEANPDNTMKHLRSLGENFEKMMKSEARIKDAVTKGVEIEQTVGWEFMSKKVAAAGSEAKQKVLKPWHNWVKPESDAYEKEGGAPPAIYVAKTLKDTFGISGVEYGSWMSLDASQFHTQACGEALADFSSVLGINPMDVSLKGRIKLAFGARGKGKAKAHYEPDTKAINLTKMAGGGSLSHEWAHAMDNIMAMVSTGGKSHHLAMMTGNNGTPPGDELPQEVVDAFKGVHEAIHSGDFQLHSEKVFDPEQGKTVNLSYSGKKALEAAGGSAQAVVDKYAAQISYIKAKKPKLYNSRVAKMARVYATATGQTVTVKTPVGEPQSHFAATGLLMGEYWARKEELFARAFESFVMDKMQAAKMKNTYLVSGVTKEHAEDYGKLLQVLEPVGGKTSVYPLGSEREKINAACEKLVGALKQHSMFMKAIQLLSLFD